MTIDIGRRQFISALGGAAAAWPLAVRAQQPSMPVVALINGAMANTVTSSRNAAAFSRGLSETGFVEGQNVRVEFHWRRGDRITGLFAALHIVSLWHHRSQRFGGVCCAATCFNSKLWACLGRVPPGFSTQMRLGFWMQLCRDACPLNFEHCLARWWSAWRAVSSKILDRSDGHGSDSLLHPLLRHLVVRGLSSA